MTWETINTDMILSLEGLGIVFYSDGAVKDIPIGEDFFKNDYQNCEKVAAHIKKGDIVGICTGCDSSEFEFRFRSGYPGNEIAEKYPAHNQLGIEVSGNAINVIDLYWLMDWQNSCPEEQQIKIEPGYYHLTFCGEIPSMAAEKELSDEEYDKYVDSPRIVYVFINRLEAMPKRNCTGIPDLYWNYCEA